MVLYEVATKILSQLEHPFSLYCGGREGDGLIFHSFNSPTYIVVENVEDNAKFRVTNKYGLSSKSESIAQYETRHIASWLKSAFSLNISIETEDNITTTYILS